MRESSPDTDVSLTARAAPVRPKICSRVVPQHVPAFSRPIEARLTDVVFGLRTAWCAGPALAWADIHTIDEEARGDLEKRIALTLREGFFNFSQLLCGLEVLLLQLHETGVVNEQTLLGIEKLVVHRDDNLRQLAVISRSKGCLSDLNSGADSAGGARNQSEVHKNPPVVDEGRVRASDSTTCGDAGKGRRDA